MDTPQPKATAADPAEATSADPGLPAGSVGRRRRRVVAVTALVAAVTTGGGLWAAALVRSPEQAAADTAAPPASVLTAPVVRRVLSTTTVLRGVFTAGRSFPVQPTTVSAGSGGPGGGTPVVTALRARSGDAVNAGQVLAEVSGRPVIALPGTVPAYRDMAPGESGGDIGQLQVVLRDMGYYAGGDDEGYFGAATKTAVAGLYRRLGYPVPTTGDQTAAAVRTARQAVEQAEQTVQDLESRPAPGADAPAAQPGTPAPAPPVSGPPVSAPAPTPRATAPTATAPPATAPGGAAAGSAAAGSAGGLARARADLTAKRQELARVQAKDGPQLPAAEVVFLPSLPARVSAVGARVGDRVTAPVLTLTAGGLDLTGRLLPGDAPLVKPGRKVTVLSETTGVRLDAEVGSVGSLVTPGSPAGGGTAGPTPQPPGGGEPYVPLAVTPDAPWDPALEGQDVRITVVAASTPGEVLAVPASAISSGVDGRTSVSVVAPDGSRRTVEVTAGVVADGFVEVGPATGTALAPGEQVVVGR
ncbi:peptidoglycan-binding protein [Kitasatospora sp. NPDC048545]|uniref:peptidoglycan-binding protein n=1 Tax=Kitasatospora sp. NPDC048545 TaxID=3157208 RepID=UPI0033D33857